MHKIKNWLHLIKFHEKVDKIKCRYFFDLMHIWSRFGCLLLHPFFILKYFFLKKPYTDFLKNHLKLSFYIYMIIFHRKIQSVHQRNLVAAFQHSGRQVSGVEYSGGIMTIDNQVHGCGRERGHNQRYWKMSLPGWRVLKNSSYNGGWSGRTV